MENRGYLPDPGDPEGKPHSLQDALLGRLLREHLQKARGRQALGHPGPGIGPGKDSSPADPGRPGLEGTLGQFPRGTRPGGKP